MPTGILLGLRVVVFDIEDARKLYSMGFYGKPLGISKPKGANFDAPLELSLVEAAYLVEKGVLEVYDTEGRRLSKEEIILHGSRFIPKLPLMYKVYKELREKSFIVRSGLKFGADFAVYIKGPGLEHAPYLVHVVQDNVEIDPLDIVRAGRLSHSVRKAFILAIVGESMQNKYIMIEWARM